MKPTQNEGALENNLLVLFPSGKMLKDRKT